MADSLLYVMAKPPFELWPLIAYYRASLGIGHRYAPERHHCTFLRLGHCTRAAIAAAAHALDRFVEEPFEVAFDRIDGNLLKGRNAQPAPPQFHRALAHHMLRCGAPILRHRFWLHLTLDYGVPPTRRATIPTLSWTVDRLLLIESGKGHHVTHGVWPLVRRQGTLPF